MVGDPPRVGAVRVGALAVLGMVAVLSVVLLGANAGIGPAIRLPPWPGPWHPVADRDDRGLLAVGAALAVGALVAAWWRLGRRAESHRLSVHLTVVVAACWAVPLALAPPLLSLDVFSYAAVGRMVDSGLDPYRSGPSVLGRTPFELAVDPLWRHTLSPYGPVMLQVLHAAAELSGASLVLTVLLLRTVAVLATLAAVVLAARAVDPTRRATVILLTALNPLVLLHLISGAHLDALIGALAVAVVCLSLRGHRQLAMVLAVVAALIKAPGLILIAFILLQTARLPDPVRWRGLAALSATAVATVGTAYLLLPDAFGWVSALSTPGLVRTWYAPSSLFSSALSAAVRLVGADVRGTTVLALGRVITLLVGAAVALVLLARATRDDRVQATLRGVGWSLVVVAMTGPTLYAWYLGWGLFAAAAGSGTRGRCALMILSGLLCFTSMPDLRSAAPLAVLGAIIALVLILYSSRPTAYRRPRVAAATQA